MKGRRPPGKLVIITGTGTGVGKTVVAAALVASLRARGTHALAVKPVCCGGRGDARLLQRAQDRELSLDEVNPIHFREPVAPLVAARREGVSIRLDRVARHVRRVQQRCECVIMEGVGGWLTPMGRGWTFADLAAKLDPSIVLVVALNRLGTLNHTLLTVREAQQRRVRTIEVLLVKQEKMDRSAGSNARVLREMLEGVLISGFPRINAHALDPQAVAVLIKNLKKLLHRLDSLVD